MQPSGGANTETLVQSIVLLFIAIDPIGNAPLFYSLTARLDARLRVRIVKQSCIVATSILFVFALTGNTALSYFGLTLADFRIAGGIVLLIYGIAGILGWTEAEMIRHPEEVESIAIVPLATPLLAGPAAIATVLYVRAVHGLTYALASVTVNTAITFLMLYHSQKLMNLLGKNGAIALSKIMAMLLAAIAVAMIRTGIQDILATT
ncbi:MarC family protein [Hyperthermus butylicus]|uniref:UPF0056 membrane protein n=1 Tax=Hyperthermus butylicus (strain DSM 5456 / JCM 9403 / PLM1-5) TaxID=415426 RepID=A2BM88_HYPBU|nr:MarC family protein [Hyperthermus butylicus]ABM81099.1 putative transporter protein [Hyperthermus butylicus DSM 5456]